MVNRPLDFDVNMLAHSLFLTIVFSCAFAVIQRPLPTPSRVPLDQDDTIYIGTAQVITFGPVLSGNIYISNMLWQDKCNALGGITVNGTTYKVAVVFVDLGDPTRALNDAEVIAKITATWTEFININGTYGRIDFSVTPFSTTYAIPALLVANPAKMFTVSGMIFFLFFSVSFISIAQQVRRSCVQVSLYLPTYQSPQPIFT